MADIILDEKRNSMVVTMQAEYTPPRTWRTRLFGRPLATADAPHQAISKIVGLAVFSSDALSSVAYSTQEMLVVIAAAGVAAFGLSIPLSLAIVVLLVILTLSYEQTIHAYPSGGGAYIVARDNLGALPALTAAASLLTDYVLTVAVSISSGVAQMTSAFPALYSYRVWIAVGMVIFIMVINLRGVKESGTAFAFPTYFFLVMIFLTVGVGLVRYVTGSLGTVVNPPSLEAIHTTQVVTLFLILRAFSSGTTALTGVEAISNGIPAFKEPRSHNAGITLIWMATILGSLFLGITFLAHQIGAIPSDSETVISQLARTAFAGRGFLYLASIAGTTIILVMAANTAFADFPRLGALVAGDGYLPRQLTYRGSRLVFSYGILALVLLACSLIIAFSASVTSLIPLYAIGVFLSFTLSQAGMAHRWWKIGQLEPDQEVIERGSILRPQRNWRIKMIINGFGAFCTAVVMMVFAVTKFVYGAWIVLLLIPILVFAFLRINHHYANLAVDLSLENKPAFPLVTPRHRVILTIGGVHQGTLKALHYARSLSEDVTAVHVSVDSAEAEKIKDKWDIWGEGIRLVILDSPYRLLIEPLLGYIEILTGQGRNNELITIVVPQFVPRHWWHNLLHTQTALMLRLALLSKPGITVTDVPYHVR